jgi:hypothetical protein
MKIAMFFIFFLLFGAFYIISENNLALNTPEGVDSFISQYASWVDRIVGNGKSFTGYITKMEWIPNP